MGFREDVNAEILRYAADPRRWLGVWMTGSARIIPLYHEGEFRFSCRMERGGGEYSLDYTLPPEPGFTGDHHSVEEWAIYEVLVPAEEEILTTRYGNME
ncbi:hypothetical protein NBM05_06330 [Rothia sp. AR01]|uniref:Uncharacterized protein n=1 Tax=Rothia santali TaxID=2949643 RepID=A0A9X2HCA5_9MICC|nr:hypothetical protein [Rothia santali]MCP3425640.1 hypothetical protein [Rothia santali]